VAGLVAGLALSGCGEGATASSGEASTRTVKHRFGTTEVPVRPKRIVALGATDGDVLAALGVRPVGVPDTGGFSPTTWYPWLNDRPEMADATALPVDDSGSVKTEQVAALRPDLILMVNSYLDEEKKFAEYSKIAPVVASAADDSSSQTWQQQTRHIGAALGLEKKAEEVVGGVQAKIDAATAANPQFKGKALSFVGVSGPNEVQVVFGEKDYTRKLLAELGFTVPARQLKELPALVQDEVGTQAPISLERLDLMDGDALVLAYFSPQLRPKLEANPVYRNLGAVRSGRAVTVDLSVAAGLRLPSPLSVPYVLDAMVPPLSAKVK